MIFVGSLYLVLFIKLKHVFVVCERKRKRTPEKEMGSPVN